MKPLEILKRTSKIIQNLPDIQKIRSQISDLITEEFQFTVTGIFELDGIYLTDALVSGPSTLVNKASKILGIHLSKLRYDTTTPENLFGRSIIEKRHILTPNPDEIMHVGAPKSTYPLIRKLLRTIAKMYGIKELGIFPCFFKDQHYGLIIVGHEKKFNSEQIDVLNLIAGQYAASVAICELTQGLTEQNRALKGLSRLATDIISSDPKEIAKSTSNISDLKKLISEIVPNAPDSIESSSNPPAIVIDYKTGTIYKKGKRLIHPLSETELSILKKMQGNPSTPFTNEDIAKVLWGQNYTKEYSEWAIAQTVMRIRKKLQDKKPYKYFVTIRNKGYLFHNKG